MHGYVGRFFLSNCSPFHHENFIHSFIHLSLVSDFTLCIGEGPAMGAPDLKSRDQ
jgi:hypothetical protein